VTTTTWTISWQDVPPHQSSFVVDPAPETVSETDVLPGPITPETSVVVEPKEADLESAEKSTEPNQPSNNTYLYPAKPERK
jgi:hypothetical protein